MIKKVLYVFVLFLVIGMVYLGTKFYKEAEVGFYFFLAYVIVSMMVSLSTDKMLNERMN